jgi:ABC-type sugar transport system ATPase subunit
MNIVLRDVVKRFDETTVVDRVSLSIHPGEMLFLLGPSGCGKTTILRMLAGFYAPDDGDIFFGKRRMNDVPPNERNTALVFQNYAIWPHLTVFENVAYGLRVRKVKADELRRRVEEALGHVRMMSFATRKPTQLSGGQQQRVALARALVVKPDLLLFDEPLSNLDAKLRTEMRHEIQSLHAATRNTSLYVTHDQEEALALADRIAVLNAGRLEQVGTPQEIYEQPVNSFVAAFIGEINLYRSDSALARPLGASSGKTFGFRPERVRISSEGIPAKVQLVTYLGNKVALDLTGPGDEKIRAWTSTFVPRGEEVRISVAPEDLLEFDEA